MCDQAEAVQQMKWHLVPVKLLISARDKLPPNNHEGSRLRRRRGSGDGGHLWREVAQGGAELLAAVPAATQQSSSRYTEYVHKCTPRSV